MDQETLKSILKYDAFSGLFSWAVKRQKVVVGSVAGSKNSLGYVQIKISGKLYHAHRLAWLYVYGYMPEKEIDHINRIRDDNRIA